MLAEDEDLDAALQVAVEDDQFGILGTCISDGYILRFRRNLGGD